MPATTVGQDVHFITFATRDLDAARRFYTGGLGWEPLLDVADEIVFFQVAPGTVLGFFEASRFAQDLGSDDRPPVSGVTLAHNVGDRDAVSDVVAAMVAGGGTVRVAPQEGAFGGVFHAIVEDPNGVVWEVAHNPGWYVDPQGRVSLDGP
ncbi:VOC family protein [Nocardioides sp. ChNu-153]|uniref:VOC family protein n=1 Tax=unclassified Nocardioides TaxID=2615069 RepID=UPI0024054C3F|nr:MULTISPECIES: VOC family protein [unclassified Nocardioides]MDF9717051.1 VOC family protein [Nocardioides sp. ChNu-99]MDN7122237.1 VOC family protein [Nocardioides sp. ChNu-153]